MGAFLTSLCAMLKSSSGPGKGHPTRVTVCQVVFTIERLLGEGGYAFVYKAVAQNSNLRLGIRQGMHVALKRFVVRDDAILLLDGSGRQQHPRRGGAAQSRRTSDREDSDPENNGGDPSSAADPNHHSMEDGIVEEVQLQQALSSHSNIVACYGHEIIHPNSTSSGSGGGDHGGIGVIKPRAEVWVIMELAGESLQSIVNQAIAKGRKMDVTFEVLPVLADTISALAFMHGLPCPVSHWDVKLDNILACQEKLAADGSVIQDGSAGADGATATTIRYKLCDFGSASKVFYLPRDGKQITVAETELDEKMTLLYRPPESLDLWEKKRIDTQADVWSLGVVLYVLLFNKMPFEDSKQSVINARVTMPPLEGSSAAGAIARQNITTELRNLCQRMLTRDPDQRPTIWDCSAALHAFYPAHKPLTPPATIGKQPPRF
jgi:serine/threonine protein kinase